MSTFEGRTAPPAPQYVVHIVVLVLVTAVPQLVGVARRHSGLQRRDGEERLGATDCEGSSVSVDRWGLAAGIRSEHIHDRIVAGIGAVMIDDWGQQAAGAGGAAGGRTGELE